MWQYLPAALTVLGMFTQKQGSDQAGRAAAANGARTQAADYFTAAQLDQQAGQSMASGQRQALEQKRQAKLVQSRALALAAASGAGASDPSIIRLMGRIGAEGAYRAGVAMYQGEENARLLRLKAAGARYEGDAALAGGYEKQSAYQTQGTSSLLSGAGTLFSRYGMGGPGTGTTSPVDEFGINWDNV